MYQKIWRYCRKKKDGKNRNILNGENAGLKYLAEEDYFEGSGTARKCIAAKKEKKC